MRGFAVLLLLEFVGCSSRGPTLLVPVENIPPEAMSLAPLSTHMQDSTVLGSIEPLHPYDLPQPTMSKASFLLRLPDNFSGEISVGVAAMKGPGGTGCVLATGITSRMFMPSPLDDAVVVSLKAPDTPDSACMGTPAVFSAMPRFGRTAGGEMVTVNGWGFAPGAEVFFGSAKATDVQYVSPGSLRVTTPKAGASGPTAIKVVNPDGAPGTATDAFRYAYDTLVFTPYPAQSTAPDVVSDFGVFQLDSAGNTLGDFLYTNTTNDAVAVLFPSLTNTTYALHTPISNPAVLDIDKDGDLDLAFGLPSKDQVQIGRNDGLANFTSTDPAVAAGTKPVAIATGDIDGDGYFDVVVANQGTPPFFNVLLNNRSGGLGAAVPYQLPSVPLVQTPRFITLLDLNRDQKNDVVIADETAAQALIFLNQSQAPGTFAPNSAGSGYITINLDGTASQAFHYDVNGDGIEDLIIPQESKNVVAISISNPQTLLALAKVPTQSPKRVAFGDASVN